MNPEISYASQQDKLEPEQPPQSFFNRLIGVYFSPGETFREIGRAPRVLVPIIALVLFSGITSYIVISKVPIEVSVKTVDEQLQRQIDSGRITQEQATQQREQMIKGTLFVRSALPVLAPVFSVILALIFAGVARVVSLMFGIDNAFKPLFAVAIYSLLAVSILSSILFVILVYVKPADEFDWENPLPSNISGLLTVVGIEGVPRFFKIFLSYADLFSIWRLILLAIGFAGVSKKLKTSTAAIWLALMTILFALAHSSITAVFG